MKKKTFAIIGAALAVVIATGSVATIYAKAATKVNSYDVTKGDVSQTIELNGNVEAGTSKTEYAAANLKIGTVNVKVGDAVKKGDVLVTFDEEELERQIALANCEATANLGSYNNSIQTSDKNNNLYRQAVNSIATLNKLITDTEAAIVNKQNEITERQKKLASEGTKIQNNMVDKSGDTDEYSKLQKKYQNNQYSQSYDDELIRLENELASLNRCLAAYKEEKALMETQKAQASPYILTEGAKSQLSANKEAGEIRTAALLENLEAAKEGIKADFDGVVKSINVTEGETVGEGMAIITVDSSEQIVLKCSANKYDIISIANGQTATATIMGKTYTGKVTRVEKIAGTETNTGVGVEVTLDDPDESLILGLEVKVKVSAAAATQTVVVPKEAVITDEDGDYVFIADCKTAVKKKVETGVKNDDYVEITSGVSEGDKVIWSNSDEIKEGADVRIVD